LQRYPDGAHAAAAKALIERVRQEEASRALLQERELELRKAEEAKHQAEAKAEEAKRADDLALAREEARKAQEAVRKAEAERAAALEAADQARKAAEEAGKQAAMPKLDRARPTKPKSRGGVSRADRAYSNNTYRPCMGATTGCYQRAIANGHKPNWARAWCNRRPTC